MKVGDIIQDYEFAEDRGIILKVRSDGSCFVLAFCNGHASWLPEDYINKCEVVNEGR